MWELPEEGPREKRGKSILSPNCDAAEWVEERLGLRADRMQAQVLRTKGKRGLLNCSRQWGKSTITAAKGVHQAQSTAGCLTPVAEMREMRVKVTPSGHEQYGAWREGTHDDLVFAVAPACRAAKKVYPNPPVGDDRWWRNEHVLEAEEALRKALGKLGD